MLLFIDQHGENDAGRTNDLEKIKFNLAAIGLDPIQIFKDAPMNAVRTDIHAAGRYIIIWQIVNKFGVARMDIVTYKISIEKSADDFLDNLPPSLIHQFSDLQKFIASRPEDDLNYFDLSDDLDLFYKALRKSR